MSKFACGLTLLSALAAVVCESRACVAQVFGEGIPSPLLGGLGGGLGTGAQLHNGSLGFGELLVLQSRSGKSVIGWSAESGKSSRIAVEFGPGFSFQPVATMNIACFRNRTHMFAFSGLQGEWSVVELPRPDEPAVPVASPNVLSFTNGNHAFAISPVNGKWQSLEFPSTPTPLILAPGSIRVEIGSMLGLFSIPRGEWAVVDLDVD